jgi:VWFA-related protein
MLSYRKRHKVFLFIGLWIFGVGICIAVAQDQAAPNSQPPSPPSLNEVENSGLTISARVDEVNLVFTVTDSRGRFVSNLAQDQFKFFDNHQPPERVGYFQQQSDLPLRVALLIDLSDSIRGRFEFEKKAASVFLKKILRPGIDEAFVVGFTGKVRLVEDTTGDVDQLAKAIQGLRSGGDTALYDAVIFASRKLQSGRRSRVMRKAIILISDGVDTASHAVMDDAEGAMVHTEAVLYALSTNPPTEAHPKGEAVLDLLTKPTGGHILAAREPQDLKSAFRSVEKALRSQYAVGYQPAALRQDGSYRSIEIQTRPGLKVQCRRGYFAPRENSQARPMR